MHEHDAYDQRREPPETIEECPKCHAPRRAGHTQHHRFRTRRHGHRLPHRGMRRRIHARAGRPARRGGAAGPGDAPRDGRVAHLRDHPPGSDSDAAPYAAVLAEFVDHYLLADMRGRFLVHRDVFEIVGRRFNQVPGIDGAAAGSPDADPGDHEPFTVTEDDAALLTWVLDHGRTVPYDGDLQYRPDPLHRVVLSDGSSVVVAPGDRLLGGNGVIRLTVPGRPGNR